MLPFLFVALILSLLHRTTAQASQPQVVVADDFAQYVGYTNSDTGITIWRGIQYAKPPLPSQDGSKNLRFQVPLDPDKDQGLIDNIKDKPLCLSSGTTNNDGKSEDCLYLNVYAPPNSLGKKLPVVINISGGGMVALADGYRDGSNLIKAADYGIIVVSFSYRVGIFGFLASNQIVTSTAASLNVGLHDQRKAIEWVNNFIDRFGGDPNHVVIVGGSAGGGSVTYHLVGSATSNDQTTKRQYSRQYSRQHLRQYPRRDPYQHVARDQPKPVIQGAIAQSPSSPPILDVAGSQYQYDNVTWKLGCSSGDSLTCLLSKTADELVSASFPIAYNGRQTRPVYMWNPVKDGAIVPDIPYNSFSKGSFVKIPFITGSDSADGLTFQPNADLPSDSDSSAINIYINKYLQDNFPLISPDQLQKLNTDQSLQYPFDMTPKAHAGRLYGDIRYQCASLFYATCAATHKENNNPIWAYQFNIGKEDESVGHMSEGGFLWGDPDKLQGPELEMQKHWVNFFLTLNPNTRQPGVVNTNAAWDNWDPSNPRRMVYGNDVAMMKDLDGGKDTNRKAQCEYLSGISGGQTLGGIGKSIGQ